MLNNFIGGGQIFLHKVRMFGQVFFRNMHMSILVGILVALFFNMKALNALDWDGFITYRKASISVGFENGMKSLRDTLGNKKEYREYVYAKTRGKSYGEIEAYKIIKTNIFKRADNEAFDLFYVILILAIKVSVLVFISIYLWWSRFGAGLKSEERKKGSDQVLSAKEVAKTLRKMNMASSIKIGKMPIVKDSEVRHFLITGSTGSGKTNLFHNILPQVDKKGQPAIVIDQTGEMISKYYNEARGDIIFNPFDDRGAIWDFWKDCESKEDLESFSEILFGFNRKSTGMSNDPFWEKSAETVFNAAATKLKSQGVFSVEELSRLTRKTTRTILKSRLAGTEASIYLGDDNKTTAGSILSVLATLSKPITYLKDVPRASPDSSNSKIEHEKDKIKTFSLKEYFEGVSRGDNAWLFLASKPSSRALTLPLLACLTDLSLSKLMDIGIEDDRRLWFVFDELASLKKLPALQGLMTEGRKYGACIIAGLQSLNQLYEYYGRNAGSTIFGQFGTNFFFRNNEPEIGKMVSSMCGTETIMRHQKNTSFGANEFRDGVSYNEQERKKNLVEYSDLANLKVKECFVLLPEPKVRVARIDVPGAKIPSKNQGFCSKSADKLDNLNASDNTDYVSGISEYESEDSSDHISGDNPEARGSDSGASSGILAMHNDLEEEDKQLMNVENEISK